MFSKSVWLGRAVPVTTSLALAASLIVPLQAQAPATAPTPPAADPSLPAAREILDRHVKAIGGREAVLSHKSAHATGTFSVPSSGMVRDDRDIRRDEPGPYRGPHHDPWPG